MTTKSIRPLKAYYARAAILVAGTVVLSRLHDSNKDLRPEIKEKVATGVKIFGVGAVTALLYAHGHLIYRASKYKGNDK
jgi:hypothetical protein